MKIQTEEKKYWEGKAFSFFSHKDCEFYPCHSVPEGMEFNCLFCYCPLYALGRDCGGNFTYLENGVKDCSKCLLPHRRESYGYITERYGDIAAALAERELAQRTK
ncbi:MAG: metal-binding protein [Clostridia bacterium]|nr:metal-binding protein [Clostridia bacterium]